MNERLPLNASATCVVLYECSAGEEVRDAPCPRAVPVVRNIGLLKGPLLWRDGAPVSDFLPANSRRDLNGQIDGAAVIVKGDRQ